MMLLWGSEQGLSNMGWDTMGCKSHGCEAVCVVCMNMLGALGAEVAHEGPAAGTPLLLLLKGGCRAGMGAKPFPQPFCLTEPALDCGCSSAGLPSSLEIQPEPGSSMAHSLVLSQKIPPAQTAQKDSCRAFCAELKKFPFSYR